MFEGWGEFYLLAGSAAAVLIGLLFVVVTLMHDRPRSYVLRGAGLYMGPIVLHMSLILALSAATLSRGMTPAGFAAVAGAVASIGFIRGLVTSAGIRAFRDPKPHWSDFYCYGLIPTLLYALLGFVALGFWRDQAWAAQGVAAVIVALLLVSIRNEWDLVVWLTPREDDERPS
jgi:hypothetical protein